MYIYIYIICIYIVYIYTVNHLFIVIEKVSSPRLLTKIFHNENFKIEI